MSYATRMLLLTVAMTTLYCGSLRADESAWPLHPPTVELGPSTVELAASADSATVAREAPPLSGDGMQSLQTVASSLAIVLGLFFLGTTLLRGKKTTGPTPARELMETLGAVQVTPKVKLHLVRFGERLLVLHLAPGAVQRVAEISDPSEVSRLLGGDVGSVRVENAAGEPGDPASLPHASVDELLRAVESDRSALGKRGLFA